MDAAALSTEGPIAFTEEDTESMALLDALIASPVFFPINLEASARPAWLLSEYLENASAAAFEAWALFRGEGLAGLLGGSSSRVGARGGACVWKCVVLSLRGRAAGGARPRSMRCRGERRDHRTPSLRGNCARRLWTTTRAPHRPVARAATELLLAQTGAIWAHQRHGRRQKAAHDRGPHFRRASSRATAARPCVPSDDPNCQKSIDLQI